MKRVGVLFGFIALTLTSCFDGNHSTVSNLEHFRTEILMNTLVEIRIFDIECHNASHQDERCEVLDEAFDLIFELERRWTVNDVGGEVERINEMAGIAPVFVEKNTFYLIEQATHYAIQTEGLFNALIGPLTSLWNINMAGERRPSGDEIASVLPLLDPARIVLDDEASTVFLEEAGMRFDLGAIAKGYMADLVADLFISSGVERALITIGGEVVAIGGRHDGTAFRIGIHVPSYGAHGFDLVGTIPLYHRAAVTSGIYNRSFTHPETGTIYHHIFDSKTGLPVDSDIVSVTVIADTGLLGEVYSTIVFALGVREGMAYIEAHPSIEAVLIDKDQMIYLSSGLQDGFELIRDDEFTLSS